MTCNGLAAVCDIYDLIEELINLSSNQNSLQLCWRRFIEEQLDESLRLLDLISAVRDSLVAIRRKGGNSVTDSRKKVQKAIKYCLRSFKSVPCFVANKESDLFVRILIEAREKTISLLQSVLAFLSKPKQKSSRWFRVSIAISKRKVACGAEKEENADIWLQASYDCVASKVGDHARVLQANNNLMSLEESIESIESALECLFRRIIQNRVSLLNVLSL